MSEVKFTEGEWYFNEPTKYFLSSLSSKLIDGSKRNIAVFKKPPNLSDVSLIKTSPKMYEMLSDLVNDYSCQCGHPRCSKELQKKEILQLLAEARGKTL